MDICQIRNVINPLLADHVTREAEHFLFMIHVLEQRLKQKQKQKQKQKLKQKQMEQSPQ